MNTDDDKFPILIRRDSYPGIVSLARLSILRSPLICRCDSALRLVCRSRPRSSSSNFDRSWNSRSRRTRRRVGMAAIPSSRTNRRITGSDSRTTTYRHSRCRLYRYRLVWRSSFSSSSSNWRWHSAASSEQHGRSWNDSVWTKQSQHREEVGRWIGCGQGRERLFELGFDSIIGFGCWICRHDYGSVLQRTSLSSHIDVHWLTIAATVQHRQQRLRFRPKPRTVRRLRSSRRSVCLRRISWCLRRNEQVDSVRRRRPGTAI